MARISTWLYLHKQIDVLIRGIITQLIIKGKPVVLQQPTGIINLGDTIMIWLQVLAVIGIFGMPYAAYRGWKTNDLITYIAMIAIISLTSILIFSVTVEHLLG